jgi:hypothetical protein
MHSSAASPRLVTPIDVFNLPLFESHFVIDTRSHEQYCIEHIASAFPFHPYKVPTSENLEQSLMEFFRLIIIDECAPEIASPIVLYGDASSSHETEWLAKRLLELPYRPLDVGLARLDYSLKYLQYLVTKIVSESGPQVFFFFFWIYP